MPSVNLAPGTQYVIAARRRRRRLFAIAFVLLILVALAWGGLYVYSAQLDGQVADVQEQLRAEQTELARLSKEAQRVEQFEKQLQSLSGLLENHVEWEPILGAVERLLPPTVRLSSLEANAETESLLISGRVGDIDQLSQTIASLNIDSAPFTFGKLSGVSRIETQQAEGEPPVVDYVFEAELSFTRDLITN